MARTVTVRGLQAMQRQQPTDQLVESDPLAIDPAAEDAADAAEANENGVTRPETDEGASSDQPRARGDAALSHEYDIIDGEVRDWRRPDTTPDRGDVTTMHQLGEEPRFSGAGAEDGQQASMFLVPEDRQFNGKLYRDAPELANIAERLIGEHGFLEQLENCDVRYFWKRKVGAPKGRKPIGATKRTSDLLGHVLGSDFAIWLAADTAREAKFTDRHVEWAVFRYLCRIGTDDNGNFISVPPDFEAFAAEIRIYGAPIENLRVARQAFQAGEQMGLFDVDAEQVEDDGAGVLIHDDGTPMSAEEVAELEESEVGDNGDDVLADPDADYDGDPLADVDL